VIARHCAARPAQCQTGIGALSGKWNPVFRPKMRPLQESWSTSGFKQTDVL
jgi:hypothetical protein